MGRPLFSTLYTPAAPEVRVVETPTPTYERWSYLNAFDPDADEFFEGENVVHEDFLPLEQEPEGEQAAGDVRELPPPFSPGVAEHPDQQPPSQRNDLQSLFVPPHFGIPLPEGPDAMNSSTTPVVPREEDFPELISPSEDSSTTASDSGRSTPDASNTEFDAYQQRRRILAGALAESLRRARAASRASAMNAHADETNRQARDDDDSEERAFVPRPVSELRPIPPSPARVQTRSTTNPSGWEWTTASLASIAAARASSLSARPADDNVDTNNDNDVPMPASPMPAHARAIPISPSAPIPIAGTPRSAGGAGLAMTPPGSVTPRFLTWAAHAHSRPRAVDMSPSPTPGAPFGSARALSYTMSSPPPFVRVHQ